MYHRRRSVSPTRNRIDPLKEEYLMEFRDYSQYLVQKHDKRFDQQELEKRYEAYKLTFLKTQNERYFTKWREEEWFQMRYHPLKSEILKTQTKNRKQVELEFFMDRLTKNAFDFSLDEQLVEPVISLPDRKTLFIKGINDNIKRDEILQICNQVEGFQYLELTDPRYDKRMSRLGWIIFSPEANLEQAIQLIDNKQIGSDFVLQVGRQNDKRVFKRLSGRLNKPKRLQEDLEKVKELAMFLDAESGLAGVAKVQEFLDTLVEGVVAGVGGVDGADAEVKGEAEVKTESEEPEAKEDPKEEAQTNEPSEVPLDAEDVQVNVPVTKKQLDIWILYLHFVHFFDYYTAIESLSPEDHSRRGALPMRYSYSPDSKLSYQLTRAQQWIDQRVTKKSTFTKDPELEIEKRLSIYIRKETEGKFRCTECQKLFRGEDFVRKHCRSKHEYLIDEVPLETQFFNNWAMDMNKIEIKKREGDRLSFDRRDARSSGGYERRSVGDRVDRGGDRGRRDARQVRSYHDLDRPADGHIQLNYD